VAKTVGPERRRRARLGSRLAAVVLLVTLPLAALSIVSAINARRDSTAEAHRRTAETVSIGAAVAEGIVSQTDLLLGTVAQLSNPSGTSCAGDLPAALVPGSIYQNLYSVAEDGTVVCTALGRSIYPSVADDQWFQETQASNELNVTVPATGLTTGTTAMIVSRPRPAPTEPDDRPAQSENPEDLGVIAASLDPQLLVAYADTVDLPPDSVVQVVNEDGLVVARNVAIDQYLLTPSSLFPRMEGSPGGTVDGKGVDGVYRLYSYQRITVGGETLYMMVGLSRGEAFDRANQRLLWSLVVIAVLGVAVGVLALAAGRSLVVKPVDRLRSAMAGFRSGDVSRRAGDIGGPTEVVELGEAFDAMADEIEQRLENQQRLLGQLEEASEAERQTIAAGIHDETLQNLSALGIRLQLLRREATDGRQRDRLDQTRELLDETADQLRGLLFDLRPPSFDRIGLAATLRETLEVRFSADLDSWSVIGEPGPAVPDQAQILLYRVAQQALANIRQHAAAHRVDIRFATTTSVVTMEITDDGRGFDVERIESDVRPGHIGLRVMRDRARAVGGEVSISSEEGEGTTVRVVLPFEQTPEDASAQADDDGTEAAEDFS
jgi:signal transduction histidine kinase